MTDSSIVPMATSSCATLDAGEAAELAAPSCARRFTRGRKRFRLRAVMLVGVLSAVVMWSAWQGSSSDTTRSLRGDAAAVTPATPPQDGYALALTGRRLAALHGKQNCTAQPETDLSILGNIVGSELCTSRTDEECLYCCTTFDKTAGVPVYFLVMLYMFLGLAIICDDYFCESLDAISEALNLSEDVAGATFMAAGSSAPELFTAIVTVLITGGSEGLGTIVGSAIFNIMIIVGVTAMFAGQELKVWWYPLTRDCAVYFLSIILMVWAIADKSVEWWESAVLVACYGGYIALMVYNEAIVKRVKQFEARLESRKASKNTKTAVPVPEEPTSRRGSVEMRAKPISSADISAAASALARKASAHGENGANPFLKVKKSPSAPLAWNEGGPSDASSPARNATGGVTLAPVTAGPGRSTDSPASTSSSRLLGKLNVGNGSFRSSPKVAPSSPQVDTVPSPVVLAGDAPSMGDGHTVTPLALDGTADSASTMAKSVAAVDSPLPNPAMRRIAGDMRTNSDVSVSQVTAALGESSAAADGGGATTAGAGLPKTGSGAGLAGLAGAFGAPKPKPKPMSAAAAKYAAPSKKAESKKEEEKKASNPMHKSEFRRVWGGDKSKKKSRNAKRAERTVRVTMKVAVAASRFRAGLMRARSRKNINAAPGSPAPPQSKMLAALNRAAAPKPEPAAEKKQESNDDDDEEGGVMDKVLEVVGWPLATAMRYTVPPCADEGWKKYYMLTFTMSILWIGLLSYVMVDMASRAGCVLGIPGLVMGLVVLAAGTSVPDALSSILVAKLGQGDMAVANVLGSNVFNILLGLGLPWLARALADGAPVTLPADEDIVAPVIVLLLYLAFFIGIIALQKWKLSKTLGVIFMVAHVVFLAWNLLTLLPDPVIKL